ncbi:MAG: choice-of-anchor L domain-containing protein [Gammaproteobacteria bacterium]|nr:choice-of-anchor L domain-containing protein [Gammaproteobacteria bacterium]MBU1725533.1 choice-of-anchor L domain-containing protein [Gammaproteobacteria bacterium]MBU2004853.1 choice-of-anchor L domain-containing protein [Gammaproteobacteria bacterium]
MRQIVIKGLIPLLYATLMGVLPTPALAALTFNPGATATQMSSILDGPGLTVSNLRISRGVSGQVGIVNGGASILGFESGVYLNTGNVGSLQGPNNTGAYSHITGVTYADPDLTSISSQARFDPAIIEFDIVPQGDRANFVFSFGSDEYPEYVCSQFNDAFGLFISGPGISGTYNAARVPGSSNIIAVNTINAGQAGSAADGTSCKLGNSVYFINNGNGTGSSIAQLDGFTKTLTASVSGLSAGQSYHVKLALADAGDPGYDSGAAFKWLTSTKSTPIDLELGASSNKAKPAYNTEVELTYTVSNKSSSAASLVMAKLDWPTGLTWLGDDSGGDYNRSTNEWNVGSIPAKGSKSLKIRTRVGTSSSTVSGEIIYSFNEDPDSTPLNSSINPNEDDTASITVNPVANQAPTITSSSNASIPENTTTVPPVSASDLNGDAISYSIAGGADASKFQINSSTGELSFIAAPDYENPTDSNKDNAYTVQVTASDHAASSSQTLTVTVTDVPENVAPTITSNNTITLEENIADVLTVTAMDPNGDTITYSIVGGDDEAQFNIDANSGKLTFVGHPDYENPLDSNADNIYIVTVSASDGKASNNQTVTITITDVEDSNPPPTITTPSSMLYYENATGIVKDFDAIDNRDSEGNGLSYSFTGQVDDHLFNLDSISGTLTFKNPPDYENPLDANQDNAYITGIKVCDSQNACTIQILIVSTLDVDEDNDHDRLMDSVEKAIGTDPMNPDTDGDGLGDLYEVVDPAEPQDHDKDGIIDALDPDDDNDTILTKFEIPDPNGDGNPDDARDSDRDGIPDYLDADDDNDTVLTRYEAPDRNGDGNPADVRDTDNDGNPDYLDTDDDGDTSLTKDEHPDPNGDGNPDDALDGDDNGIPSWLDASEDFTVSIQVRAFLNGAYNSATGMMDDELFQKGLVPDMQPYGELKTAFGYGNSNSTASPFDYTGTETMSTAVKGATGGNTPVDWVLIELRDALDPTLQRGVMAAVLQRDGDIVDAISGASQLQMVDVTDGRYYVVIRHRNHLGVMTAAPLSLTTAPSTLIDFTHPDTKVFGGYSARLQSSTLALLWSGDTNNSNTIILSGPGSDSNVILGSILVAPENLMVNSNYRLSGYYATDLNMDGYVIFSGPNNEINLLIGSVLLHPGNTGGNANYIVNGTIPR